VDVVLAIDASGSARSAAVDTAIEMVQQLDLSRARLAVLSFNDIATVEFDFNDYTDFGTTDDVETCVDAPPSEVQAVAWSVGLVTESCEELVNTSKVFCAYPIQRTSGVVPLASVCERSCGRCEANTAAPTVSSFAVIKQQIIEHISGIRQRKLPNKGTAIGVALEAVSDKLLQTSTGWRSDPDATVVVCISVSTLSGIYLCVKDDGEDAHLRRHSPLRYPYLLTRLA
jgi:hypothetical protein